MVRWPRPRFRVRTLLILAAVAGLAMGLDGMRRRRSYCLRRAEFHRSRFYTISGFHFGMPIGWRPALSNRRQLQYQALRGGTPAVAAAFVPPKRPPEAERVAAEDRLARDDRHYAWHLGWARRYEQIAARPWGGLPDEPEETFAMMNR